MSRPRPRAALPSPAPPPAPASTASAFAADGKTLAAGCDGKTLLRCLAAAPARGGSLRRPLLLRRQRQQCLVRWTGRPLAAGCANGKTLLWDVAAAAAAGATLGPAACDSGRRRRVRRRRQDARGGLRQWEDAAMGCRRPGRTQGDPRRPRRLRQRRQRRVDGDGKTLAVGYCPQREDAAVGSRGRAHARRDPLADLSSCDSVGSVAFAGTVARGRLRAAGTHCCGSRRPRPQPRAARPSPAVPPATASPASRSLLTATARRSAVGCGNGGRRCGMSRPRPRAALRSPTSPPATASTASPRSPGAGGARRRRCWAPAGKTLVWNGVLWTSGADPPAPGLRSRLAKPHRD